MRVYDITFRQVLITFTTWWILWLVLHYFVVHYYGVNSGAAITDSVVNTVLLTLTAVGIYNTLRFYRPARGNVIYLRIWAVLHSITLLFLHRWLATQLHPDAAYLHFLDQSMPIRFCYMLLMTAIITIINALWFVMEEEREKQARQISATQMAREAELSKLRQQLQPHFLFNSLNSINALVGTKPEEARKMIHQLSDFLRGTLRKDDQQLVPLKDELHHLKLYLDIEKVRFGHRLQTIVIHDEESDEMMLPSLLLQPVVENAIKFGLYDTTESITIKITATTSAHMLEIRVENPFDEATSKPKEGTGFGLTSIQRRLYLLYARNDLLQTTEHENLFITTIKIPQP